MKVSFLKPPTGGIIGLEMITFVEPLGLECIGGGLEEEGHDCQIVDLRIDGLERGIEKCVRFEPRIVGVQCNFTTERFRTLVVTSAIRRALPDALIVVGGHDASRDPSWFCHPTIDVVAVGDGEEIMPLLAETYDAKSDLSQVPGLMLVTDAGPQFTRSAPAREEIDELPMPARHLIAEYADSYYINFRRPLALLETARGCPFKCNFCSVWKFHDSSFREKSPQRVVAELQQIEAPNVFITDDIFWMNVRRGEELAEAIQAAGIRKFFTVQTRSDIICKFPHLIEKWKGCGPLNVFLGLEKIDDEGLESVNKGNSAENNERALRILEELGVGYTPNFIVDPDWRREDFENLRQWISRTGAFNSGFSVLTPLPGTDLWDEVKQDVVTDDWELFDIAHSVLPTNLPLDEFYNEYAGLWRHAMQVRYEHRGRIRTNLKLLLALASGKVSLSAMKKGLRIGMGSTLSRPDTFLRAHLESAERLQRFRPLIEQRIGAAETESRLPIVTNA